MKKKVVVKDVDSFMQGVKLGALSILLTDIFRSPDFQKLFLKCKSEVKKKK